MRSATIRTTNIYFMVTMLVLWVTQLASAQPLNRPPNPADEAAGAAACTACCGGTLFMIILMFVILALNLALLIWVARDAKNRNMDSAVMWMILVMATGPIGLIIYVFSRPQGNLIRCDKCGNSRMQASTKCPHCGNV